MKAHAAPIALVLMLQFAMGMDLYAEQNEVAGNAVQRTPEDATSFSDVVSLARRLSAEAYRPTPPLPESLTDLNYEQYRTIQYRHDAAIWKSERNPFWLEGFHRGFVQKDRVDLRVIEDGRARLLPFQRENFVYGEEIDAEAIPAATGFAGLKVVGMFPESEDPQEMLTFLGSSYFRCRSRETVYGTSNRGLAVNIGLPRDEEFPVFRTFWVPKPEPGAKQFEAFALLDGPSVCGAYRFVMRPQAVGNCVDVESVLFFRDVPEKVGLAPLTSMWMWGDGIERPPLDYRLKVHDADGLLVYADNEWIWRGLSRQEYPSVCTVHAGTIQGFGLMQRETDLEVFRDHNAQYHKRPSVWVTPLSKWPRGRLELLELPGAHEGIDNIGAYWVPDEKIAAGEPFYHAYRIEYFKGEMPHRMHQYVAEVRRTAIDRNRKDGLIGVEVTFAGKSLGEFARADDVQVTLQTIRAELMRRKVTRVDANTMTVSLLLKPEGAEPMELSACLMDANRCLSEHWKYLCAVEAPPYQFPAVYTRVE